MADIDKMKTFPELTQSHHKSFPVWWPIRSVPYDREVPLLVRSHSDGLMRRFERCRYVDERWRYLDFESREWIAVSEFGEPTQWWGLEEDKDDGLIRKSSDSASSASAMNADNGEQRNSCVDSKPLYGVATFRGEPLPGTYQRFRIGLKRVDIVGSEIAFQERNDIWAALEATSDSPIKQRATSWQYRTANEVRAHRDSIIRFLRAIETLDLSTREIIDSLMDWEA